MKVTIDTLVPRLCRRRVSSDENDEKTRAIRRLRQTSKGKKERSLLLRLEDLGSLNLFFTFLSSSIDACMYSMNFKE